jgi:hypothetical protein
MHLVSFVCGVLSVAFSCRTPQHCVWGCSSEGLSNLVSKKHTSERSTKNCRKHLNMKANCGI